MLIGIACLCWAHAKPNSTFFYSQFWIEAIFISLNPILSCILSILTISLPSVSIQWVSENSQHIRRYAEREVLIHFLFVWKAIANRDCYINRSLAALFISFINYFHFTNDSIKRHHVKFNHRSLRISEFVSFMPVVSWHVWLQPASCSVCLENALQSSIL